MGISLLDSVKKYDVKVLFENVNVYNMLEILFLEII